MTLIEPRTFRWTREEYYKLYDQGMFASKYGSVTSLRRNEVVTSLAFPNVKISIDDLM